ncbi:MAG: lysine--tRNA ligase [Candidatus Nanoarchaeia archaeon]
MAEKFFWADHIAEQIIKRNPKKKTYVCASGITPSGTIHIGNFREVITVDLVVRALSDKGKKARFIYSWDDYDRFRKVPVNISKSYEKYIGMPLSEVPSPFPNEKELSYAEHFEKEFEKSLEKVGIKPEFIRQSKMSKQCKYAKLINHAIKNKNEIKKILDEHRKEPLPKDWIPLTIYSEKDGKDFTKILSINDYVVEYVDKSGFKGKIDYRKKGIVKLPWRVDWPARWYYEKVDFEPGGIDHSVQGGSFDTSKEVVKIFDYVPPLYTFYEWVRPKGGKEFASSTGNVITLKELLDIYEPEIIRYLFVSTRPNKGFAISFDNDIIKIYDEYDKLEDKYYSKKANNFEKRIYELSQVELKSKKKKPEKVSFKQLITLVQVGKTSKFNKDSKLRAEKVKNWLDKYASSDFKFEVQEKVRVKLSKKQKEALKELRIYLGKTKKINEKKLFNQFYSICESIDISNKEFFNGAYNVLINKDKGPRLASLITAIGKDKVIKLLKQIK